MGDILKFIRRFCNLEGDCIECSAVTKNKEFVMKCLDCGATSIDLDMYYNCTSCNSKSIKRDNLFVCFSCVTKFKEKTKESKKKEKQLKKEQKRNKNEEKLFTAKKTEGNCQCPIDGSQIKLYLWVLLLMFVLNVMVFG